MQRFTMIPYFPQLNFPEFNKKQSKIIVGKVILHQFSARKSQFKLTINKKSNILTFHTDTKLLFRCIDIFFLNVSRPIVCSMLTHSGTSC